ncbi:MAG: bifunctional glutamate N-acetyltransferase/amino-acid acetyltransferase ArgJ [Candidatus Caldatribacteriota bacterium]
MQKTIVNKDFEIISGGITYPQGIKASGLKCGIRLNKKDLALIYSEKLAEAAAVYTTNKFKAAPLIVTENNLIKSEGKLQAILINSGIANACTGQRGLEDARQMADYVAEGLSIDHKYIAIASTGKIGEFLPLEKIKKGLKEAISKLSDLGGKEAAEAILTTDTTKKEIALNFKVDDKEVRIGGMAKGSGMIHPNMATMLAFITTDISISPELLKEALQKVVAKTFNMISVDGDTSTNDMVIVMANGLAGNQTIIEKGSNYLKFFQALHCVGEYLAKCIVKDGEGASKMMEVEIQNAPSFDDAKRVAKAVINSPLVKTAIFGADPNWGRILAAVGYSGVDVDPGKVDLYLKEKIVENGQPLKFSRQELHQYLSSSEEIKIIIDLKRGKEKATAWGCDLTYDYVKINTKYS